MTKQDKIFATIAVVFISLIWLMPKSSLGGPVVTTDYKEISGAFLASRSSSTHQGAYLFTCSPMVETLDYEFKGAYYSSFNQHPQENRTEILIQIFGTSTNPKEAFENLIFADPNTNCIYEQKLGSRYDFDPNQSTLRDKTTRSQIIQDVEK